MANVDEWNLMDLSDILTFSFFNIVTFGAFLISFRNQYPLDVGTVYASHQMALSRLKILSLSPNAVHCAIVINNTAYKNRAEEYEEEEEEEEERRARRAKQNQT